MSRPQKKHDRIAFIACTSLALGIIVLMWIWSVRAVVGQGVQGSRQVFSDVSATAGAVRKQSAPDPETIASIKEGLKSIVTKKTDDTATPATAPTSDPTVDAVAQLMKNDVETYGQEPKN
ncbi:MAG: hypothetical protein WCO25_04585 [Candidatus Uhrbacteria bacterium]